MIRVIRKTKGEEDSQNIMADTLNVYGKQWMADIWDVGGLTINPHFPEDGEEFAKNKKTIQ